MIGYLKGKVLRAGADSILLDVGGVGYAVAISLATYSEIERAGRDGEVGLHVFTHLWSDGLALYGFWTELEKRLFERLITVSGIGPRLARVILSGMPPETLIATLAAGDAARLTTIPGVGKKSAERMIVELRDKVQEMAHELGAGAAPASPGEEDLISALVNLGYKRSLAGRAVRDSLGEAPDAELHVLLRASLKRLSGAA